MKSHLKASKTTLIPSLQKAPKTSSLAKYQLRAKDTLKGSFEAYTVRNEDKHRLLNGIKLLGVVEAGFPTHAEEDDSEHITFDDYLIDNREASYILRVKGDSMSEAGIFEGDLVIVERGKQPQEGDIVIAQIDGDWTMKYYKQKAGNIYLEPANKKYPLLFPEGELTIAAVVTAVVRKY